VPLLLYQSASAHPEKYRKGKEQSEYANNMAHNEPVLLFGFANLCLMHVVNNRRLLTS